MSDLERDYNGYNNGVTSILKASQNRAEIKNHLIGVVANMIDVPQKYRTAIETALGSNVQNIIVEKEEDAEMLINFLKTNKYGQATFLPLTSAKSRKLRPEEIKNYNMEGCLGIASDIITYDAKIDSAVKTLLGRVVICDNIHNARILAKQNNYSFRTVTLDGDQTFTNGSLSGGSQKSNVSHILNRQKDIEELDTKLKEIKTSDAKSRQERLELLKKQSDYNEKLETIIKEMNSLDVEMAKNKEIIQSLSGQGIDQEKQIESYLNQISACNKKISECSTEIDYLNIEEQQLTTNMDSATENIELTQKQLNELQIKKDEYQEEISNIKVEISTNNTQIASYEDNILRLSNSISQTIANIESLKETLDLKSEEKHIIEGQIAVLQNTKQYIEIDEELEKVENKLIYFDGLKKSLFEANKQLEEDRSFLLSSISSLTEKKNNEDINLTKVDMDLESMEKRVWEEYELTYGNCLEYKLEDYDLNKGIVEAQGTRRDIERLGNVNLNALQELAEQQEKYDRLKEQIADLERAELETNQIIDKLSKQMKTKFEEQFAKIDEYFSKTFTELFGGGKAKLILLESETEDPLEQGVDIQVELPGKPRTSISLLSGGEQTFTAIAILFAILKLRSMPFVFLDEVEAALDEMNIVRFAKYLKRFSNSTQFIVVTHRKPTMERADRLCGVTLQNTVSIIVNIALSDALKIADEKEKDKK